MEVWVSITAISLSPCRSSLDVAHLIHTSELKVNTEVLLIESLHTGVQQTAQERRIRLLDDLGTGLGSIVKGGDRRQSDIRRKF